MGSDRLLTIVKIFIGISIHAPRMGSDFGKTAELIGNSCISIHAPRMGSDPPIRAKMTTSHIFQSTLPHGERQIAILGIPLLITISIHAPAWGATTSSLQVSFRYPNFNPRPRMGSDNTL